MAGEQYRSSFALSDFMAADVACPQNVFTRLGSYTVPAGMLVSLGYGANESQEGSPGRLYFDIRDNTASPGAVIDGIIRISVVSPQDRPIKTLCEFPTTVLRSDKTNRTLQVPFPASGFPFVSKDRKISIELKNTGATKTVSLTNSYLSMDTTVGVTV